MIRLTSVILVLMSALVIRAEDYQADHWYQLQNHPLVPAGENALTWGPSYLSGYVSARLLRARDIGWALEAIGTREMVSGIADGIYDWDDGWKCLSASNLSNLCVKISDILKSGKWIRDKSYWRDTLLSRWNADMTPYDIFGSLSVHRSSLTPDFWFQFSQDVHIGSQLRSRNTVRFIWDYINNVNEWHVDDSTVNSRGTGASQISRTVIHTSQGLLAPVTDEHAWGGWAIAVPGYVVYAHGACASAGYSAAGGHGFSEYGEVKSGIVSDREYYNPTQRPVIMFGSRITWPNNISHSTRAYAVFCVFRHRTDWQSSNLSTSETYKYVVLEMDSTTVTDTVDVIRAIQYDDAVSRAISLSGLSDNVVYPEINDALCLKILPYTHGYAAATFADCIVVSLIKYIPVCTLDHTNISY